MSKFDLPNTADSKESPTVYCCSNCGCEWFSSVQLSRFRTDSILSFGQRPAEAIGEFTFPALICGSCNTVHSLPINSSGLPKRDTDLYYKFIEHMRKEKNENNQ